MAQIRDLYVGPRGNLSNRLQHRPSHSWTTNPDMAPGSSLALSISWFQVETLGTQIRIFLAANVSKTPTGPGVEV